MKLVVDLSCKALALNARESKDRDGKPKNYYSLSILTPDGQAGMLSCSDEVAEHWEKNQIEPMTELLVNCEYNDQYGSFKVVGYETM